MNVNVAQMSIFYYIHKPDYIQSDQFQEKYEMKLRWTVVGFVCPLNISTQQPRTIGVFETGYDCYIYWRHNIHREKVLVWLEHKKIEVELRRDIYNHLSTVQKYH